MDPKNVTFSKRCPLSSSSDVELSTPKKTSRPVERAKLKLSPGRQTRSVEHSGPGITPEVTVTAKLCVPIPTPGACSRKKDPSSKSTTNPPVKFNGSAYAVPDIAS